MEFMTGTESALGRIKPTIGENGTETGTRHKVNLSRHFSA
jgi:hypothetical protein